MQNPLFKVTALLGVISAGMAVVYEAQQHLGDGGGVENFAPFGSAGSPTTADSTTNGPSTTARPTQANEPTNAFLLSQTEPGDSANPPAGRVLVSGPTAAATPAPKPDADAFAFLYGTGGSPTSVDSPATTIPPAGLPVQGEPLVTASLESAADPADGAAGLASIQLTGREQLLSDAAGVAGLQPFPVEGGAPVLLPPPSLPPTPPRPGEESWPAADRVAQEMLQAKYETADDLRSQLIQTGGAAEVSTGGGLETDLLAQADPFPTATGRTREPVPASSTLNQTGPQSTSETRDLFGPLPTEPLPARSAAPESEVLVLPAGTPSNGTTSDDPFAPAAIPGTGPGEAAFLPEASSVPPPRNRELAPTPSSPSAPIPALFPEAPTATTTPPAGGRAPIEDLFLPEELTPARPAGAGESLVFPSSARADDPFAPSPAAAATPNGPTAATPLPNRSRDLPAQPGEPAAESPLFASDPTPINAPTRTAQPTYRTAPELVLPPEPSPSGSGAPTLLEPSYSRQPTVPAPPSSIPAFPSANDLGGAAASPTPVPSGFPGAGSAPTPLTFPERNSIPSAAPPAARSMQPEFNLTPNPGRTSVDPLPNPSDLAGTGLFDSSAPTGMQPELQIEKDAPPKAVLNQPLVYNIRVRNVGRSAAHQVIVEDGIPKGSRLEGTNPEAELDPADKHLVWRIGTLAPGEERLIRVKVVPTEPGEIGSVATVRFVSRIAAKTIITAPKIALEMNGPAETAVGDVPVYRFRVTNVGDGDANNVIVKSAIPNIFQHPSGNDLEYTIGALRAGQSRDLELALSAVKAGQAAQTFVALVDDREQDQASADVVVLASRITIDRTGPERRFVNRPADYVTQVTNQSSEPLRNVTVMETLPAGIELAAVPQHGRYDPSRRTITWVIPQLGPQATQQIHSSLVTADQGTYATSVQVWDAAGNKAEAASQLQVAGFSSLKVDVAQTTQGGGEVAVGDQVALRMTVANRGSAPASEVVTEFEIPPELEFVAAKPTQYELVNGKVRFQAIPRIEINGQQVIDIVCVARQPGRPQIAASIWSNEQTDAIRQAEAVVVYRLDQ